MRFVAGGVTRKRNKEVAHGNRDGSHRETSPSSRTAEPRLARHHGRARVRELVRGRVRRAFAVNPAVDYSKEPTTLVVFELADAPNGTLLTLRESGFDHVPLARRAKAFEMNDQGWTAQVKLVEKYLAHAV